MNLRRYDSLDISLEEYSEGFLLLSTGRYKFPAKYTEFLLTHQFGEFSLNGIALTEIELQEIHVLFPEIELDLVEDL